MTMNRVIHGAVRRDLRRLEDALAVAADGDTTRAGQLNRAFGFLHAQLVHHHRGEDEHVFPAMQRLGVDLALLGDMEEEHERMANALADTESAMQRYAATGSAADRDLARESVVLAREATEQHHLPREAEDYLAFLEEHGLL